MGESNRRESVSVLSLWKWTRVDRKVEDPYFTLFFRNDGKSSVSSEQLCILKQIGQSCVSVSTGTDSIAKPPNFMSISITRDSWKRGCGLNTGISHTAHGYKLDRSRSGHTPVCLGTFSRTHIPFPIHFIISSEIQMRQLQVFLF